MTKIFSPLLISSLCIFSNAYSMNEKLNKNMPEDSYNQINAQINQISSEFQQKHTQLAKKFEEISEAKTQVNNILLEKMNDANTNPEQILLVMCEFNEATSINQINELAQKHSISLPNK